MWPWRRLIPLRAENWWYINARCRKTGPYEDRVAAWPLCLRYRFIPHGHPEDWAESTATIPNRQTED